MDAIVLDMTQEMAMADEELADELAQALRTVPPNDPEAFALAALPYNRSRLRIEASALRRAVDAMQQFKPPAEAKELHGEAIRAGEQIIEVREELASSLKGVDSIEDLEALDAELGDEFDIEAPGERFEDACYGLEDLAEANNLDANLQCSPLSLTF